MLFWVYRKQKLHPWFTVSHALVETVRCLVLQTVYSHKWLVRRIYGLPDLVETIRNAFTEFTVWLVGITVSLFWSKLQTALTEFMCLADFYSLPRFGWNCFLAALTELFCQSEFIVSLRLVEAYSWPSLSEYSLQILTISQVWLKLLLRISLSTVPTQGLPIFGRND